MNGRTINVMINLVFDYKLRKVGNVLQIIVFGMRIENYVMIRNVRIISIK